jgi:hypothetical protein
VVETPKHGRRPAQRVFWGTTRHPDLKVKPDVMAGQAERIIGGSLEALAHELVFATQFDGTNRSIPDREEMVYYKVFLWTVLIQYHGTTHLQTLFREMVKCLRRAIDAEDISIESFASRIRVVLDVLVTDFGALRLPPDSPLSPIIASLLETGMTLCQAEPLDVNTVRSSDYYANFEAPTDNTTSDTPEEPLAELKDLPLQRVVDAMSDMLFAKLRALRLSLCRLDGLKGSQGDTQTTLNLFYSHGFRPRNVSKAVLADVLARSRDSDALADRAKRLSIWIHLAELCRSQDIYAPFIAICQALFSPPILRLDGLWDLVPMYDRDTITTWRILAGTHHAGRLPFHTPLASNTLATEKTRTIPYLGPTAPNSSDQESGAAFASWHPLARLWVSEDELESGPIPSTTKDDASRRFVSRLYGDALDGREPMSHWMDLSREIQPSLLSSSSSRSWSRAEGRNMSSLQPLLYTTPLPINTLFATGTNLPDAPSALLAKPESRRPPSLLDTSRAARRTSMPSRRSSLSDNSSYKWRDGEAPKSEGIGNAVRRITGQLHNATIRITDEIELQVADGDGSSPNAFPLTRTSSRTRCSLAVDPISRSGASLHLAVNVKYASTERLIDLLICGIEGDGLGSDDNGQMPLNFSLARKFALDLDAYRRTFFATYRSFLEPTLLFEASLVDSDKSESRLTSCGIVSEEAILPGGRSRHANWSRALICSPAVVDWLDLFSWRIVAFRKALVLHPNPSHRASALVAFKR